MLNMLDVKYNLQQKIKSRIILASINHNSHFRLAVEWPLAASKLAACNGIIIPFFA